MGIFCINQGSSAWLSYTSTALCVQILLVEDLLKLLLLLLQKPDDDGTVVDGCPCSLCWATRIVVINYEWCRRGWWWGGGGGARRKTIVSFTSAGPKTIHKALARFETRASTGVHRRHSGGPEASKRHIGTIHTQRRLSFCVSGEALMNERGEFLPHIRLAKDLMDKRRCVLRHYFAQASSHS